MNKEKFIGEALKSARLLRGFTLSTLAEKTGITKQSISLYENNTINPEFEKGIKLADALSVPYSFFFHKDSCKTQFGTTYFRSLTTTTKLQRMQQTSKLEYVARMREALMNYIIFPQLNIPNNETIRDYDYMSYEDVVQIDDAAMRLRKSWDLGDEPITNLQYTVEANGIVVTGFVTGTDGIDAFSQRIDINGGKEILYAIAVSLDSYPEGRIIFDIAHELGHILLHPWSEDLESLTKEEFRRREVEANRFAGAFLMPMSSFGKDVSYYGNDLSHYVRLKDKWKVSIQAMIVRSFQIGAITANQYQYLMRKISKNGWRKKEPGDCPYEINENVFQSAIDLLIKNNFKPSFIMSLFADCGADFYPDEIENLLHLRKGTLSDMSVRPTIISFRGNE